MLRFLWGSAPKLIVHRQCLHTRPPSDDREEEEEEEGEMGGGRRGDEEEQGTRGVKKKPTPARLTADMSSHERRMARLQVSSLVP